MVDQNFERKSFSLSIEVLYELSFFCPRRSKDLFFVGESTLIICTRLHNLAPNTVCIFLAADCAFLVLVCR